MDDEMSALYAERSASAGAETARKMSDVFHINAADIMATILVLDGDGADATAVGHAALRPFEDSLEVKRVFVAASHRRRGISSLLLAEVEGLARARGVKRIVLQTGDLQVEAIALYERRGYRDIPPFRGYEVVANGRCFEKFLD
jgi:GNAT superfamily N-acetyltransferase